MVSHQPLVSILVAAYNSEKYIAETLQSALAQTYQNFEIIVVDDGSRDRTGEIVASVTDPRIRYIFKENEGIPKTRNRLLREARGEFLTYLDSDDIYLPTKVEDQVHFLLQNSQFALVYCDMFYFFDGSPDKLFSHTYTPYSGKIFAHLLDRMFIVNTSIMLRRSVIETVGVYDETMREVEDLPYFLTMAWSGLEFGYLDKRLVRYRLRSDSNTNFGHIDGIAAGALYAIEKIAGRMTPDQYRIYNMARRLQKRRFLLAIAYLSKGKRGDAFRSMWPILEWRSWLLMSGLILGIACFPSKVFARVIGSYWRKRNNAHFIPL
jgi:glycosyltransferase involved in cell wall biosynthesis